jgi:uncharacterized protein (DUF433 family)
MGSVTILSKGAYLADRAAALSGVPLSTVHYWSRKGILVPSVSQTRVKLWSYTDLMGLRMIYWLRKRKPAQGQWDIPATTMPAVRRALRTLAEIDVALWTEDRGPAVRVDPGGHIYIDRDTGTETLQGDRLLDDDAFDLIAPMATQFARGPDLYRPRPTLRIIPGKLSGSPHIAHSRIETLAVAALSGRGYERSMIESLYPHIDPVAIVEAVDLESQLAQNLRAAA